jgi:hypothetical protein
LCDDFAGWRMPSDPVGGFIETREDLPVEEPSLGLEPCLSKCRGESAVNMLSQRDFDESNSCVEMGCDLGVEEVELYGATIAPADGAPKSAQPRWCEAAHQRPLFSERRFGSHRSSCILAT